MSTCWSAPRQAATARFVGFASAPIGVAPVVNVEDMDLAAFVVDAVTDAVLATSRAPQAVKRGLKRRSHTPRLPQQRTADELPRGEGSDRRQALAQRPSRAWSQD